MTKGKHAASQNKQLRAQLEEGNAARRRLEGRLAVVTRERDEALERLAAYEKQQAPAIAAERMRADAAQKALTQKMADLTRENEQRARRLASLMVLGFDQGTDGVPAWSADEWGELRSLGGAEVVLEMMERDGAQINRNHRRNVGQGGNKLAAQLKWPK